MREKAVLRVIDANLNRFRESLRVCEEVARFNLEDKGAAMELKKIRHETRGTISRSKKLKSLPLLNSRDSANDVGKAVIPQELERTGCRDVLDANLQRAKESARVLEEFFKIIDKGLALEFKKKRFLIYGVEKTLGAKVDGR